VSRNGAGVISDSMCDQNYGELKRCLENRTNCMEAGSVRNLL